MSATEVLEPATGAVEANTPTEVPESPDATSAPGGAGEEPAGTGTEPTASGRPRDEKGRFTKQEIEAQQAADAARAEGVTATELASQPAPPAPAPVKGDPFTFRAEGQRIPLPGSVLNPDGSLQVAPEHVPQVRQLLADAISYRTTWRRKEQDYKTQLESAGAPEKARADRAELVAAKLIEALGNQEWMTLAVSDPREAQYLIRELALEFNKAKLDAPRAPEQPKEAGPSVDPQQLEADARGTLKGYVEELLERPQARLVYDTPEKRQKLEQRLQRRLAAYFTELEDGQIALHENAVDADFEEELNEKLAIRNEADKKRKAEEFNAKRNQPAGNVPPVVSTKAPPAAATTSTTPTSREEWRRNHGLS